jgi:arylsulfatase A-like enzyme
MDDNIGLVLAKLEAMGQLDNTIVIFTTDNGSRDHALTSTCSAIASASWTAGWLRRMA